MSDIDHIPPPKREKNPVARMFGAALMAVGGLIASLCGLCSLGFVGATVLTMAPHEVGSAVFMAIMIVMVGGIPTFIGFGIFVAGRQMYKDNG